ncbi:MAG: glycine--tRNA ligase [Nitrososphaerales archaeon]
MNYEQIIRLMLERGFLLPSSEIYADALAGFWDYGPLGVALKNKYVELWRRYLVRRDNMVEIDGCQIMPKSVFVASGHLAGFEDPIVSCTKCNLTLRADRLIQEKTGKIIPERLPNQELDNLISSNDIRCPNCGGNFGNVRRFNMMFKVNVGPSGEEAYLRPETCQSIFVDFPRLFKVMRCKLPVAFAQYGKSFRNEISPRQSLMRLREFYQAEIEVFFNPDKANEFEKFDAVKSEVLRLALDGEKLEEITAAEALEKGYLPNKLIAYYLAILKQFYQYAGLDVKRSRFRKLGDDEKAFYASSAFDFEVKTSLGWIELVACNHRGDYDLSGHSKVSKKDMTVLDGDRDVLPNVFELSMGVDRSIYAIIEHSLVVDGERTVLRFKPYLAPIQVGVFPLVTRDGLPEAAKQIYSKIKLNFEAFYDESGSIGRRYRRMDEIGTPFCITVDYQTLEDNTVTIRDRDTMKQDRVKISELEQALQRRLFTYSP